MRLIYEFDGSTWSKWLNRLPLPVHNNTVVSVPDQGMCSDAAEMDERTLREKRILRPDTSMNQNNNYGRCGAAEIHEFRKTHNWISLNLGEDELDGLVCYSPKRGVGKTYFEAKKFCNEEAGADLFTPPNKERNEYQQIYWVPVPNKIYVDWWFGNIKSGDKYPYFFHWLGIRYNKDQDE